MSLEESLNQFVPPLETAKKYMEEYQQRSYLRRVLSGQSDAKKLRTLDEDITKKVQSIQLSMGVTGLKMQQASYAKLDRISEDIKAAGELKADSPVVADVAAQMGVDTKKDQSKNKEMMKVYTDLSNYLLNYKKGENREETRKALKEMELAFKERDSLLKHAEAMANIEVKNINGRANCC